MDREKIGKRRDGHAKKRDEQNQINGTEEQIQEVFRFLQDDKMGAGSIDFGKITPMPQWVYGSSPDETEFTEETEMKWGEKISLKGGQSCIGERNGMLMA